MNFPKSNYRAEVRESLGSAHRRTTRRSTRSGRSSPRWGTASGATASIVAWVRQPGSESQTAREPEEPLQELRGSIEVPQEPPEAPEEPPEAVPESDQMK